METFEEAPDYSEFAIIHPTAIGHGHIMRSDADWDCQCFARLVGDQSERSSTAGGISGSVSPWAVWAPCSAWRSFQST